MKNIILFDGPQREHLLPFTYLRPVGDLRLGLLSLREKWEYHLKGRGSYITREYLGDLYPIVISEKNYIVNAAVLPDEDLVQRILALHDNEALLEDSDLVATCLDEQQFNRMMDDEPLGELTSFPCHCSLRVLRKLPDLLNEHDLELRRDFERITAGRRSAPLPASNRFWGDKKQLFIEEGAEVEGAMLNATKGPIYIGKGAVVMEGSLLRGPIGIGEYSTVKMGARLYGPVSLGPHCKVGGELSNVMMQGYSNKGHDGYLGDSVIGQWCNLGADTNTSNLKNNYSEVKLWDYVARRFVPSGRQFCGLFMGDHSKSGINTMFNTGTVVGLSANVFGSGYPRNFIPSFSWGGASGFRTYLPDKAFETAERMMARRNKQLSSSERIAMLKVFEDTVVFRTWEQKRED